MNCPVCNSELIEKYNHGSNYGTEESMYECDKCKYYSEQFAYGNTEIHIGDFMTGYNYKDSGEYREKLYKLIKILGKAYKEQLESEDKNDT